MSTTIAAVATPPGRGGVGVIRLSGPRAVQIAGELSPTNLTAMVPRRAHLVEWVDASGDLIDQGLAIYFPAPNSYTGEDVVELHGHGSPVLLRSLVQRLIELGCEPAAPGEFTRRAVENGKMDLSQAEAVAAAIDASTVRAGKVAQRQLHGDFGRHIDQLMLKLTGFVAHVEASLDFPEEEVPPLFFDHLREEVTSSLLIPLQKMLETAQLGERLFDGARVAIIGSPNVGKSSLLNALAGYERAIVSEIPGTTRDLLEIDFEVHGIPLRIVDTAGLRISDDVIEQEGVRRAEGAAELADVVIFVADMTRRDTWEPHARADLMVMNKIELSENAEIPAGFHALSIRNGTGLDGLRDLLASRLGDLPIGDEGIMVTRERHRLAIAKAIKHLEAGLGMLGDESQLDLAASEWRTAWSSLGDILGIGDVEHILDRVFSEFCIGK